jgi:L-seryl-tRNA(Ser) seleniumtransferase
MRKKETTMLRLLPSVDALLHSTEGLGLRDQAGARLLTLLARTVTEELRTELLEKAKDPAQTNGELTREYLLNEATHRLKHAVEREMRAGLRRVINATGVLLHTNLGRAPLSKLARTRIIEDAAGYCALEFDLDTGLRGRRGGRAEDLLCALTGARAAIVVNNCAAAALLVLSGLARDGETIVSRGELVEIGGDFRIPEIMAQSGTTMVEVGTTNRTKLSDYEHAISENTKLVMRVHPSNYRVVGFTSCPSLAEVVDLAHAHGLSVYKDAGSGALFDLTSFGLAGEPAIRDAIRSGADLVSFSGDKLLGGSQAGIIVGRREPIERLRHHPLYRTLRADKLALASLEATIDSYRRGAAAEEIPVLRMLATTEDQIKERVLSFKRRLLARIEPARLSLEMLRGVSAIGGGAAPTTHPPTILLALTHERLSAAALETALRHAQTPVIARIVDQRVVLDLRTVAEEEEDLVLDAIVMANEE